MFLFDIAIPEVNPFHMAIFSDGINFGQLIILTLTLSPLVTLAETYLSKNKTNKQIPTKNITFKTDLFVLLFHVTLVGLRSGLSRDSKQLLRVIRRRSNLLTLYPHKWKPVLFLQHCSHLKRNVNIL